MSKVDKTLDNLKRCLCPKCPSYTFGCKVEAIPGTIVDLAGAKGDISKLEHLEGMFCAYEKSNCINEQKGCLCGDCEVHKDYNLDKGYYCIQTGGK
ncbi:MAG: hypothetical protein ACD_20C00431G0010 [uncultured bacterium]|nr:MAG: hypothetical protein ACD_20C00431G0010 [uncultured bacterium]